ATFILLYMIFTKLFPIVSIWEVREGRERGVAEVEERVRSYLPGLQGSPGGDSGEGKPPRWGIT
ncbi:MAG: hypothetical protein AAB222_08730, partial [Candidatus Binatota bacterium]